MDIALISQYSRREELLRYREKLKELGHTVTSRWLDGPDQIGPDGVKLGEGGEKLLESGEDPNLSEYFAELDLDDLEAAELVICFTEPAGSNGRGGRHVEYGFALGNVARIIVIGSKETMFHYLAQEHFESFEEMLKNSIHFED